MSALIEGSWISVYLSAFNWLRCYLEFFVIHVLAIWKMLVHLVT